MVAVTSNDDESFRRLIEGDTTWEIVRNYESGEEMLLAEIASDGDGNLRVWVCGSGLSVIPVQDLPRFLQQTIPRWVTGPKEDVYQFLDDCLGVAQAIEGDPHRDGELEEQLVEDLLVDVDRAAFRGVHPVRIAMSLRLLSRLIIHHSDLEPDAWDDVCKLLFDEALFRYSFEFDDGGLP